jgi:hypothetical protein
LSSRGPKARGICRLEAASRSTRDSGTKVSRSLASLGMTAKGSLFRGERGIARAAFRRSSPVSRLPSSDSRVSPHASCLTPHGLKSHHR